MKLLVIEDDKTFSELLATWLREDGFEVEIATSLKEAQEKLGGVTCALVDLGLPDADGLDAPIKIHELSPRTPMAVVTGNADPKLMKKAVEYGVRDYLVKTALTHEKLMETVEVLKNEALRMSKLLAGVDMINQSMTILVERAKIV